MKEMFKKATNSIIISSILAFIVGLIMVVYPKLSIETMGIMAAIYIIVHGIILICMDIKAVKYYIPFDGLLTGILSIILGIILLCMPGVVSVVFTIIIGVWMILSSINYIKIAIKLCGTKLPWITILLLGILDLIAGIIVIFNPFEATISITLFAGIMLMVHSVVNIIDILIIKRDVKEISKELEKKMKEFSKEEK